MTYTNYKDIMGDNLNRYQLTLATAKCARIITDEYVKQREAAEKSATGNKEADKPLTNMIDKELKDEKSVKLAIDRIRSGEYTIVEDETAPVEDAPTEEQAEEAIEVAEEE